MTRKPPRKPRGAPNPYGPDYVDVLRANVTGLQRTLLGRLWSHEPPLGWVTANALLHRLPPTEARKAVEALGGSVVAETQGGQEESYVLTLLGALLHERGPEFERLLGRYLAYLVERYNADSMLSEITSEDVARDLSFSELDRTDLYRLVTMASPSLSSGSSRGPKDWSLRVPRELPDLTEVQNWTRFIRERAMAGYDPQLPVRVLARREHEMRVQTTVQRQRRREVSEQRRADSPRRRPLTESSGLQWITPFSPGVGPDWTCPTCRTGSLLVVDRSLSAHESKASRDARDNEDWSPDWVEERATIGLRCARPGCGERVTVLGVIRNRQVEGMFETYEREFHPTYVEPFIAFFDFPLTSPKEIITQVQRAFALFWLDAPAAANRVRASVERLLDHQRVPKAETRKGKRLPISLHKRIESFRANRNDVGDALMAVKWIGNEGSHESDLTQLDLLDAFEMLSYALDAVYDDRRKSVSKLAKKINRAKGSRFKNTR